MALDHMALIGLAAIFVLAVVVFGAPVLRAVLAVALALVVGYIGLQLLEAAGYPITWANVTGAVDWVRAMYREAMASV